MIDTYLTLVAAVNVARSNLMQGQAAHRMRGKAQQRLRLAEAALKAYKAQHEAPDNALSRKYSYLSD